MNTDEIRKIINSEDRPDDIWFIETIEALCAEVDSLRDRLDDAWEQMVGEDV